jgi:hypothetical protein
MIRMMTRTTNDVVVCIVMERERRKVTLSRSVPPNWRRRRGVEESKGVHSGIE